MITTFWLFLSIGCIGWYLVVLGYVAVKGAGDIKRMLAQLSSRNLPEN
ncbi:MAG: hypothetical protein JW709_04125 [Sedimentisphaerales bacterium]|nr:hypothetical protein [Sedimentisphaerales bacterium]